MIVVLYKSFDITDKLSEDFHVKIYEILSNFIYFYCISNKANVKSIVNAILIIITAHIMADNSTLNSYTVLQDFVDVRIEFLNNVIMLINDNSKNNVKKIFFKIIKHLYFIYTYISSSEHNQQQESSFLKKISLNFNKIKSIKQNIKNFILKATYDKFLINELKDEEIIKLIPFIYKLSESDDLQDFSETFFNYHNLLKSKDYILEMDDRRLDLKDKINDLKDAVSNKEIKYFKCIEDYNVFLQSLKNEKIGGIEEENSRIMEEEDEDEESEIEIKVDKRKSNPSPLKKQRNNYNNISSPSKINSLIILGKSIEVKANKRRRSASPSARKINKRKK